jgi:biopolymer transport protein ExbD
MKMSRRALRMERHHRRHRAATGLNLVSLMDIFTILVFFLLVNSSEVELLPSTRSIELPESVAEERPRETVVVMVTDTDILVQGERVADLQAALADGETDIAPLTRALEILAARGSSSDAAGEAGPEATVMAARTLPYSVIRRVMLSCAEAGYGQVSFAVLQRAGAEG